MTGFPDTRIQGVGVGLRSPHIPYILEKEPSVPWLEILADNHLARGGTDIAQLEAIRSLYPMTMHGVNLSLGGPEKPDLQYLQKMKQLFRDFEISWYSEHLCFTRSGKHQSHDLLPLPYTEEAIFHCVQQINLIQDVWGERLVIENVSAYVSCNHQTMTEADFLLAVVKESDCELLLDLNNLYVNQINFGEDATQLIKRIKPEKVREIHLAGYEEKPGYLLDAHNNPVSDQVWELYRLATETLGNIPSLIEWDNNIPSAQTLLREAHYADSIQQQITGSDVL